jgi:[ribosomal protein S18]-alanine N-acetyltransferase
MAVTVPIVVERMRMGDIAAVHEIERLSFATPWPSYAFEQELTSNRLARYVVARAGASVVGFGGLWLMVDEAHITTFAVLPDWRRRGIGGRLMVAMMQLATEMQARVATLEVRLSNEPARQLYQRFGFRPVGLRPRYYSDNGEDALIMTSGPLESEDMRSRLAALARRYENEPLADAGEAE